MHTLAEQVFSARVALSSIDGPGADRRIQDHVPLLLEPRVSPIFFFSGLGPDPGGGGGGGGGGGRRRKGKEEKEDGSTAEF